MVVSVSLQMLLLAALGYRMFGDLRRDCSKAWTLAVLLTGLVGGVFLRLLVLLTASNSAYGNVCRTFYSEHFPNVAWVSHLTDAVWVIAEFMQAGGLLFCGGAGLILAWWTTRVYVRGTRMGKITTLGIILFVALSALWIQTAPRLAPHLSSRYQAEDESLASLPSLLGKPVKYHRIEGWTGLAYVNYVYLPPCTISDSQLDAVIAQFKRFPRLRAVDINSVTMTEDKVKRLRAALPDICFGSVASSTDDEMEMLPRTDQPR